MNQKIRTLTRRLSRTLLAAGAVTLLIAARPYRAYAENSAEFNVAGNKLTYSGRLYDPVNDRTHFYYDFTRSLLASPLQTLQFHFGNCLTAGSLTGVSAAPNPNPVIDLLTDTDTLQLSGNTLRNLTSKLDLTFLGNVQEGNVGVEAAKLLGGITSGNIKGPQIPVNPNSPTGVNCTPTDGNPVPPGTTPVATPTPANLPSCLLNPSGPIQVPAGQPMNLGIQVNNGSNEPVTVSYAGFPAGAELSVPSGTSVSPGEELAFNWIPEAAAGITHLPLTLATNPLSGVLCDLPIQIIENGLPVLNLEPVANPAICQGTLTQIPLDASASFDPDGNLLNYHWTTDCQNATLTDSESSRPILQLSNPGTGAAQSCSATVSAGDGITVGEQTIPINVLACDISCADADKDLCGVCHGTNACIDCAGQLNGVNVVDRCGVCGGDNSCVDCQGVVNGSAEADACGICNGDGSSCRSCEQVGLRSTLTTLDGTARQQAAIITRALRNLKRTPGAKKARSIRNKVNALYTSSWAIVWQLSQTDNVCSSYAGCTASASGSNTQTYRQNAARLKKFAIKSAKLIAEHGRINRRHRASALRKVAHGPLFDISGLVNAYPPLTYNCGG